MPLLPRKAFSQKQGLKASTAKDAKGAKEKQSFTAEDAEARREAQRKAKQNSERGMAPGSRSASIRANQRFQVLIGRLQALK
jgi:flagellar biosynthesis/type III secretory pathway protein FliH